MMLNWLPHILMQACAKLHHLYCTSSLPVLMMLDNLHNIFSVVNECPLVIINSHTDLDLSPVPDVLHYIDPACTL